MPFSFLNPWFWLGAVALAAPIWLHLSRKKETRLQRFSALRFLEDEPLPRRGPLRLRDLLLFLLRALALLLLVGAFAWPYLRGANTVPVRESRVYVLDNTLSHQANAGFDHDRERILSDLGHASSAIQIAVVELASMPRVVASFGDDRELAKQKLRDLKPSYERGSYLAAFRQANTLLNRSLGAKKRIVFLGDNQANQWSENTATPPFLHDVEVDLPKLAASALPNLSLAEPRAQRIFLGEKSLVNFTVKLSHTGEAKTAGIQLQANGQLILNRSLDLSKQPETLLVQAQWEAPPGEWLRGEASVEGSPDALAGDNRVYFSLPPLVEGKVALLAHSPWLRLALSPEIMRGEWSTRTLDPTRLSAELAGNQDAEVLVVESNYLQATDARRLLKRYLDAGRGVILLVDRVTPTVAGYLRELGFQCDGTVTPPKDKPARFQFIFSNHPIFHPFLSPDYGNLLDIRVSQFARLKSAQAMPLVFSESGAALFFQTQQGQGKLFVAAFGLDREHTSWPVHPTFIPFLDLTLQAARAEDPTPTSFEPGETALVQLPAGTSAREVVLRADGREVTRAPVEQGRAQVPMPGTPGVYALSYDDREKAEKLLSINPSPKESQLAYSDASEMLKLWRLNRPPAPDPMAASAAAKLSPVLLLQQRSWWWMMVGGVLLLLLEMAWADAKREPT